MEAKNDAKRSYEEIEPYCKWQKDEANDILQIHLQGYKKEQLRVQLNNLGILVVTGECPVDQTKWIKFRKEIKVSEDCKRTEIRAKLTGGVLYITMPKISSLSNTTRTQNQPDKQNQVQHDDIQKPKKLEEKVSGGYRDSDGAVSMGRTSENLFRLKRTVFTWTQMGGKRALKLGALAAVVVVVSVGAYVAYKYRKSFHVDN
ncbi:hypothetical protein LWI28_014812 [Acer negundo]|uniref:SHSP domain-containing protein n=1 Tax=Acer negundo TaxID=4023 RepID=A0AAD5J5I8_ACENE|nr:hypothetical protein LWI28_014812 [Acer negundo]KAK4852160.1 hypothetical protein QYF36_021572 [Acer negundo]